MKKYLLIGIIAIVILMPIAGSYNIKPEVETALDNSLSQTGEQFTHTVMVEYATLTTCPPCVTASSQLNSIYNSGDLDFYFVSLVSDQTNYNIRGRLADLGVQYVPDVFFDGGYRDIIGGQTTETPYRNAITQSGERDVPDIDIDVSAEWKGNGAIKLNVNVQNNEPEDYKGLLRVYIVEKESRWNDNGGNPYHYAAIAMPFDTSLAMPKSDVKTLAGSYSFSKTWRGSMFGFGDITQGNIMVIASVFDQESGYAVQAAATELTSATGKFYDLLSSRPLINVFQFIMNQIIFYKLLI
jgi:hypothetical protein